MSASEVMEAIDARGKSGENGQPLPRAQQRSGSSASNGSDEDAEDHKSGGKEKKIPAILFNFPPAFFADF